MSTRGHFRVKLPAGTGAARLFLCIAVILILSPYTTSWGASSVHFTLVNTTRQYLHVVIGNRPYLYVGPGAAIDYEISSVANLNVDVTYSPGQGVKGHATKTVRVELETSGTGTFTNDCSKENTCTHTSSATYNSQYVVTPARWGVTPAEMSASDSTRGTP